MKTPQPGALLAATLLAITIPFAVAADLPEVAAVSVEQYQATLEEWSRQVGEIANDSSIAEKLRSSLPNNLRVHTERGDMETSTAWLNTALEKLQKTKPEKRGELIKKLQERLASSRQEAQAFLQPAPASAGSDEKLQAILQRREFRMVRGPSAWDEMVAKAQRWLFRLIDKIFSRISAPAQAGQLLVWITIAFASCVLAVWLKRTLDNRPRELRREPIPFAAPSSKSSRKWLAEAQASALAGHWRDAIHLAYWAGIARLEEGGAWVPNRARTPREYLRLLSPVSQYRPALSTLTQKFEVVWYGNRAADASDFQQVVTQLERLQCRL